MWLGPLHRGSDRQRLARCRPALLASVASINPDSGFWDEGSNWSNGIGPQAGDDVTIVQPGNITVTVHEPVVTLQPRTRSATSPRQLLLSLVRFANGKE